LLAEPQETVALHGDPHHGNMLEFAHGDWRAIDPKDRFGERGFDHAQILCNPDLPSALDPARMARQWRVVAQHARLEPLRLLRWIAAHAALSAAWTLEDEDIATAAHELATAETALRLLAEAGEPLP
jgi:streptomycin 6-kinase